MTASGRTGGERRRAGRADALGHRSRGGAGDRGRRDRGWWSGHAGRGAWGFRRRDANPLPGHAEASTRRLPLSDPPPGAERRVRLPPSARSDGPRARRPPAPGRGRHAGPVGLAGPARRLPAPAPPGAGRERATPVGGPGARPPRRRRGGRGPSPPRHSSPDNTLTGEKFADWDQPRVTSCRKTDRRNRAGEGRTPTLDNAATDVTTDIATRTTGAAVGRRLAVWIRVVPPVGLEPTLGPF